MRGIATLAALAVAELGCSLVYGDGFIEGLEVDAEAAPAEILEGEAFVTLLVRGHDIPADARLRVVLPDELGAEEPVELVGAPVVASDGEAIAQTSFWPVMTGLAEGESAEVAVVVEAPTGDGELQAESALTVRGLDELEAPEALSWEEEDSSRTFSRIRAGASLFISGQATLRASHSIELHGTVLVTQFMDTGGAGGTADEDRMISCGSAVPERGVLVPWSEQPICGGSGGRVSGDSSNAGGRGGNSGGRLWLEAGRIDLPTASTAGSSLSGQTSVGVFIRGEPGSDGDISGDLCEQGPARAADESPTPANPQGGDGGAGGIALIRASRQLDSGSLDVTVAGGLGGYEPILVERRASAFFGEFSTAGDCWVGSRGDGGTVRVDAPAAVDLISDVYEMELFGCDYYVGQEYLNCLARRSLDERSEQRRGAGAGRRGLGAGRAGPFPCHRRRKRQLVPCSARRSPGQHRVRRGGSGDCRHRAPRGPLRDLRLRRRPGRPQPARGRGLPRRGLSAVESLTVGRAGRRKRKRWNAKRRRRQRNREQAFQRGAVGKGELRFDLEVGKLEVVLGHDGL